MKHLSFLCIILFCAYTIVAQPYLQSVTHIKRYSKTELDSILDHNGLPSILLNNRVSVDVFKVNYLCKDAFDTLVGASGLMIIPVDSCRFPLLGYSHGTISRKNDAPSRVRGSEVYVGMVMGSNGYLTVLPDYLGLGDGAGLHPYQHAKTEAYANIYLLRAAREYCTANAIELNGQLFLAGYSQGGHAAMATQRMIETDFTSEFTVTACAPMSGAYDMSGVMVDVMLSNDPYPAPAYLPYIVLSWNPIYNLYTDISNAFKVPYDTLLPPLFDGTRSLGYIEARMPNVPKLIFDSTELYRFTTDINHPFRLALRENNTYNTSWIPQGAMRLFYCSADMEVSYLNAYVAQDSLKAKGCNTCDAYLVSSTLGHYDCAQYALIMCKMYFDSLKITNCNSSHVANTMRSGFPSIVYPNPADASFSFFPESKEVCNVQIIDLCGKEQMYIPNCPMTIDAGIRELPNGLYFVKLMSEGGIIKQFKIQIQHE